MKKIHRDGDKPAIIDHHYGNKEYYRDGVKYIKEESDKDKEEYSSTFGIVKDFF